MSRLKASILAVQVSHCRPPMRRASLGSWSSEVLKVPADNEKEDLQHHHLVAPSEGDTDQLFGRLKQPRRKRAFITISRFRRKRRRIPANRNPRMRLPRIDRFAHQL